MEIRKLDNPWSDDLEALVQALPMCWSVEDEMHIKPVDIVRNNDFENPEIGVTHMKDLFLDVTHWRYTSQVDQYRKAFSDDLAAARRSCFNFTRTERFDGSHLNTSNVPRSDAEELRVLVALNVSGLVDNVSKALEPVKEALAKLDRTPLLSAKTKARYTKKGGSNGKD